MTKDLNVTRAAYGYKATSHETSSRDSTQQITLLHVNLRESKNGNQSHTPQNTTTEEPEQLQRSVKAKAIH